MRTDNMLNNRLFGTSLIVFTTFVSATSSSAGVSDTIDYSSVLAEQAMMSMYPNTNEPVSVIEHLQSGGDRLLSSGFDLEIGRHELAAALYDVYASINQPCEIDPEILAVMPEDFSDLYI